MLACCMNRLLYYIITAYYKVFYLTVNHCMQSSGLLLCFCAQEHLFDITLLQDNSTQYRVKIISGSVVLTSSSLRIVLL